MDHIILSKDTLHRIRRLRDNVLDLSLAIDDIDQELHSLLERRAHLDIS